MDQKKKFKDFQSCFSGECNMCKSCIRSFTKLSNFDGSYKNASNVSYQANGTVCIIPKTPWERYLKIYSIIQSNKVKSQF